MNFISFNKHIVAIKSNQAALSIPGVVIKFS